MFITEITATAGVTFDHPFQPSSNFRPGVAIKATIMPHEDAAQACIRLQAYADKAVELQRQAILERLETENEIRLVKSSLEDASRQIDYLKEKGGDQESITALEKLRGEYLAKLRSLQGDDAVAPNIEKLPEQPA